MLKWKPFLLAVVLILGLLSGCTDGYSQSGKPPDPQASGENGDTAMPSGNNTADLPTIRYHFVADRANPSDTAEVAAAVNELIAAKVGANVDLIPLSFEDVTTKVPLILSTGDESDIICINSSFVPFTTSYQTGGLIALDSLLANEAPELLALYEQGVWSAAKVKGETYMVPNYFPEPSWPGVWTAKERTDTYGFDWENADSWEAWEPYMDAILENEPGVTPMLSSDEYWGRIWFPNYYGWEGVGDVKSAKGQALVCVDAVKGDSTVFAAPFTDEYEANIRLMRSWYEKGYVLQTPPTEAEMGQQRMTKTMAAFFVPFASTWDTTGMGEAEWGGDTILQARIKGKPSIVGTNSVTGAGSAITKASKNPEAAIRFIQEMHTNEAVHNLLTWGIEGKHWQWLDKSKNIITFVDGENIETVGYYPNTTWQFGPKTIQYNRSEGDYTAVERAAEGMADAVLSPIMGFLPDTEPLRNQIAIIANVAAEYGDPLEKGLVDPDDPNNGLEAFRQKLTEAGIEEVVAALQKQIDDWLMEN